MTLSDRGGAQVHLLSLVRGFLGTHDQILCVGETGFLTEAASEIGVPFYVARSLKRSVNPLWDLRALAEVIALVRLHKPDAIHAHTAKAGFVGRLAGRITRCPVVFTPHGWSFSDRGGRLRRSLALPLERMADRWSARTIVVSVAEREAAKAVRLSSRIHVVHNGIEETELPMSQTPNMIPKVVMVARFASPKDHLTLLQALAMLALPYRFLLVGDGPLRADSERTASRLNLDGRVEFLGTRSDVPQILSQCDVFVLSSRSEALPLSIIEAMRAGLPVVASKVGGVSEAVIDGVTGYLCPPADPAALCRSIDQLLRDVNTRRCLGAAGRDRFLTHFTMSKMLAGTKAIYDSVVESRQRASQELKAVTA